MVSYILSVLGLRNTIKFMLAYAEMLRRRGMNRNVSLNFDESGQVLISTTDSFVVDTHQFGELQELVAFFDGLMIEGMTPNGLVKLAKSLRWSIRELSEDTQMEVVFKDGTNSVLIFLDDYVADPIPVRIPENAMVKVLRSVEAHDIQTSSFIQKLEAVKAANSSDRWARNPRVPVLQNPSMSLLEQVVAFWTAKWVPAPRAEPVFMIA
ncbi:MAG: hypothetical protein HZA95_04175 [Candidatus Vogelbacteria bacterium]|nr:hypothetical protein [Candidatus Vogelbacteria bacterium]